MSNIRNIFTVVLLLCQVTVCNAEMQDLVVSENHLFLQYADGTPFFWLGDTGWLLPTKLNREDVKEYLTTAARNGYNVVQLQTLCGVPCMNAYGQPSNGTDPWNFSDVENEDENGYWKHMDFIINEAERHGIYVGMVCIWGGLVKSGLMDVEGAKAYGAFLANRYKDHPNIIWIIGGDIPGDIKPEVWNALATTIKSIDHRHLMTYHPRGRYTSARWWSKAEWIDFHMYQSGHRSYGQRMNDKTYPIPDNTEEDCWMYVDSTRHYTPLKPVLDGEPSYEDIPKGLHFPTGPRWKASDVRRYAYWDVFAGTFGHTYGHNAIMQMHRVGDKVAYSDTSKTWQEAQRDSGYIEMKYLKALMLTMPFFERVADQSVVKDNGIRYDRLAATRGRDFLLVYNYTLRQMNIDLTKISGEKKNLWWMDAADGRLAYLGVAETSVSFNPKNIGAQHDGILIAVDADRKYIGIDQTSIIGAISVTGNLYNQNRQNADLGLERIDSIETVNVFMPDDNTDHFSNGVCMTGFKGALYCMWQSSKEYEDSPDTWVAYSRSTDDGKTWSRPMTLCESPEVGSVSSGGWLVNDNELVAYINVWNESHKEGYAMYKTSKDGLKWSKENRVLMADGTPMQAVIEQDPHVLPSGRIINAAHFHPGLQAYPVYTDDRSGKRKWHKAHFVPTRKNDDQSRELEPSSFVKSDGTIVMFFRDQNSSYHKLAATSHDNGETWTTSVLTNIPDSRSKQCAGNFPDGTAYFVSNPVLNKFRYPLAITLSKDGSLFDKAYLIHSYDELPDLHYAGHAKRKGYSYPKSCIIGDYLYISYSVNKENVQYTRIPLRIF